MATLVMTAPSSGWRRHAVEGDGGPGPGLAARRQRRPPVVVLEDPEGGVGQRPDVPGGDEHAAAAEHLGEGAVGRGHHRGARRHGLEGHEPEALATEAAVVGDARHEHDVGGGDHLEGVVAVAEVDDGAVEAPLFDPGPDAGGVGRLVRVLAAHQHEAGGGLGGADELQGVEGHQVPLHRVEAADEGHQGGAVERGAGRHQRGPGSRPVEPVVRQAGAHHPDLGPPIETGHHRLADAHHEAAPAGDPPGQGAVPAEVVLHPDHRRPAADPRQHGHERGLDPVGVHDPGAAAPDVAPEGPGRADDGDRPRTGGHHDGPLAEGAEPGHEGTVGQGHDEGGVHAVERAQELLEVALRAAELGVRRHEGHGEGVVRAGRDHASPGGGDAVEQPAGPGPVPVGQAVQHEQPEEGPELQPGPGGLAEVLAEQVGAVDDHGAAEGPPVAGGEAFVAVVDHEVGEVAEPPQAGEPAGEVLVLGQGVARQALVEADPLRRLPPGAQEGPLHERHVSFGVEVDESPGVAVAGEASFGAAPGEPAAQR
jgi:hypothetical protein